MFNTSYSNFNTTDINGDGQDSATNIKQYHKKATGRLDLLGPNTEQLFAMSDRIHINGSKSSLHGAMNGNWYDTKLSEAFFSAENIQILQNGLRAGVFAKSNNQYIIGEQSFNELGTVMRAIFLQKSKNLPNNIIEQISDLNKEVLEYTVKSVYGEADGYMKYKRDVSTISLPLPMPILVHNSRQLDLNIWF